MNLHYFQLIAELFLAMKYKKQPNNYSSQKGENVIVQQQEALFLIDSLLI